MRRPSAITFRQLRAFVAVAQEGSIARAAQRLFITPSALSMLISSLEAETGMRMFERTTRRMVLTSGGSDFLPSVLRLFQEFDGALESLEDLAERRRSHLRIAASPLMAATLLPQAMAGFRMSHPSVKLSITDVSVTDVARAVRSGEADLGICTADVDSLDLQTRPICKDRLMLVCPATHGLAAKGVVRWQDLSEEPLVLMRRGSGLRNLADQGLAALGASAIHAFEVSHVATAVGLVEAGLAVAILPGLAVARTRAVDVNAVELIDPAIERAIVALSAPERPLTEEGESFLICLQQVAERDGASWSEPESNER